MKRTRESRAGAAAACIGELPREGEQIFAITEGQFSLIDGVEHALSQTGPAATTWFVWSFGEHDLQVVSRLHESGLISDASLIVDRSFLSSRLTGRGYASEALTRWRALFGAQSVKLSVNHAKIVLVRSATHSIVIRSSMNPNLNTRFENMDLSHSAPAHDFHRAIFDAHACLPESASGAAVYKASGVGARPNMAAIVPAFKNLRRFSI